MDKLFFRGFIYLVILIAQFLAHPLFCNPPQIVDEANDQGEFNRRMEMAYERLTKNRYAPVFTEDFILADVRLNSKYPRRFSNFSGDLSGRYIEVMSLFPDRNPAVNLGKLVNDLLKYQQPDGRFGDSSLVFQASEIGSEHMALLWGNGRLLVGLLQYYATTKNPEVLLAAKRLGDFFIDTYQACAAPEIRKKLEGFGATGFICFTQYIEGLVRLSEFTNDPKYAEIAAQTYPLLPERGVQHSHGYLTTLRGVLLLYKYDHNQKHLNFVRRAYDDLIDSDDFTIFGSVREYFGHDKSKGTRDEGCATADFVRLSLELYKITLNIRYLEKGEFALYNALYFNQYYTGDFGHHLLTNNGSEPSYLHAAWWCCTMHGLRALYAVQHQYMVQNQSDVRKLNLFLETDYHDNDLAFTIRKKPSKNQTHFYSIAILENKDKKTPLALRIPSWSQDMAVTINGQIAKGSLEGDYFWLKDKISTGDTITVGFDFALRIFKPSGESTTLENVHKSQISGALCYGPYLMGIDGNIDPTFTAEPQNNLIDATSIKPVSAEIAQSKVINNVPFKNEYLQAMYQHGGFPSNLQTIIRPVASLTYDKPGYLMVVLDFNGGINTTFQSKDDSLFVPWKPE